MNKQDYIKEEIAKQEGKKKPLLNVLKSINERILRFENLSDEDYLRIMKENSEKELTQKKENKVIDDKLREAGITLEDLNNLDIDNDDEVEELKDNCTNPETLKALHEYLMSNI